DIALSRRVGGRFAGDRAAQIFIGRDIEQPRLRAVGDRRPVLAAPKRRTEIRLLAGPGLTGRVDIRPARFRVELEENVLLHKRFAVDEVDLVPTTLEHPQIAVACAIDETFNSLTVVLV